MGFLIPPAWDSPPGTASGGPRDPANLVGRVEGGDLAGLRHGRVAEHGVDKGINGAAAAHYRLAGADKLSRAPLGNALPGCLGEFKQGMQVLGRCKGG